MSTFDFDAMVAQREVRQRKRRRTDALVLLGVGLAVAVGVLVFVRAKDDVPAPAPAPTAAVPDAAIPAAEPAATSAYDAKAVEEGLADAAIQVVATEPDPAAGQPRVAAMLQQTEFVTGCGITGMQIEGRRTEASVTKWARQSGHGFAVARVEYAEPDWKNQYAAVVVTAVCSEEVAAVG